ncbi:uncharacterized protein DMAD_02292 [Drosophila madeirensis]
MLVLNSSERQVLNKREPLVPSKMGLQGLNILEMLVRNNLELLALNKTVPQAPSSWTANCRLRARYMLEPECPKTIVRGVHRTRCRGRASPRSPACSQLRPGPAGTRLPVVKGEAIRTCCSRVDLKM